MFLLSDVFITSLLTIRSVRLADCCKLVYLPVFFLALLDVFRHHYSACFLMLEVALSSAAWREYNFVSLVFRAVFSLVVCRCH